MPGKGSDQDTIMDVQHEDPDDEGDWEAVGCRDVIEDVAGVLLVALTGLGFVAAWLARV